MITQSELKLVLTYDPTSGLFIWNKTGDIAGTITKDKQFYICITIRNKKYYAHQLAFLWMTGAFAKNQTDHINRNGCDNRWVNLRDVTPSKNCLNRKLRSDNTSGICGVRFDSRRGRWQAYIRVQQKMKNLGWFRKKEDAIRVRQEAESTAGVSEEHGKSTVLHGIKRS